MGTATHRGHRNVGTHLGLVLGALWFTFALTHVELAGDFQSFYQSGANWNQDHSPYPGDPATPNLNPPSAVVLIFAPLARLPLWVAARLWMAVGLLSVLASLRAIQRELHLNDGQIAGVAATLLGSVQAFSIWFEGQVVWFLMYPLTKAWIAYRGQRRVAAGMWAGPVIAIKPMFAIAPVFLGAPTLVSAGLTAAAISGAVLVRTGPEPWMAWLSMSDQIRGFSWPTNGSLWGALARLLAGFRQPISFAALEPMALFLVPVVLWTLAAAWRARRNADAGWLAAHVAAILLSPIGWAFYAVMLTGPVAALYPTWPNRWRLYALGLLVIPVNLLFEFVPVPHWIFASVGSVATAALLILMLLTSRRSPAQNASRALR